jgi:hypothetical protein
MSIIRDFFTHILSEDSGNYSSLRFVFIGTSVLFIPAFVFVWTYTSINQKIINDVPLGVTELMGTLLLGKSLQKGVEVYGSLKSKDENTEKNT